MKVIYLLLVVLIPGYNFAQNILKGVVSDEKGKPIAYANLFLKKSKVGAVSDDNGSFVIETGNQGTDTLIVSSLGFQKYKKEIILNNSVTELKIVLQFTEKVLEEVFISAGTIEASNERSVAVLKPLDIVTTAGGQGDIVGAIQTLPGVQRNGGDQTGLMVRGGDVNESSMIIDGMIAQNAFQSSVPGVSQRSRFNPFQFKGTSFSSGGYTARYGQALSAVLDLQTNDTGKK